MSEELEIEEGEEKGSKRLSESEWAAASELYELGDTTLEELSAKFGVSTVALSKGLRRRGVKKGAKAGEVAKAVAAATAAAATAAKVEEVLDAAAQRKRRIDETKKDHYTWSTMIGRLTMAELARAQAAKEPFSSVAANIKALRHAHATITQVREERYSILDAAGEVDEKELPELPIRELTDLEIEELRSRDPEDDLPALPLAGEEEDVVSEDGEGAP
ncbi:hypothetical protein [Azospirillum argentinense]|uniref:hypothetical protein n=1 Tax=Azospirillum argentinense TaxID=2970906 RepID=UPI0032DFB47A